MSTRHEDNSREGRLTARLAQRLDKLGHRPDLLLSDFQMAGDGLARVAVTYTGHQPTHEELVKFFAVGMDGKVLPHLSTAAVFPDNCAIALVVEQHRMTRPHTDSRQMVKAGPQSFIDTNTQETWAVGDNAGTPILVRLAADDLEAILAERHRRGRIVQGNRVALHQLLGRPAAMASPGAQVRVNIQGDEEVVATVMGVANSSGICPVRVHGESIDRSIHQNQINEVVKTAELDANAKEMLERYFAEAYGDASYAAELVREASFVGDRGQFQAFLTHLDVKPGVAVAQADLVQAKGGNVVQIDALGIPGLVLGRWNGNGYEYQVNVDAAESAPKAVERIAKMVRASAR